MQKREYTDGEKNEFNEAGRKVRGIFKLLHINNSTQEYLPLKRAIQFKIVKPDRTYTEILQDIVDNDVSPACSTIKMAGEVLTSAVEDFLLDVKLSDEHQKTYDNLLSDEEKINYVLNIIAEKAKQVEE